MTQFPNISLVVLLLTCKCFFVVGNHRKRDPVSVKDWLGWRK